MAYFRPDTLPQEFQSELTVTRHYTPRQYGFTFTNGIQASLVEVDVDTGFVRLLGHWCVEDSGTVINPMLADEQLRGGIVQGIGAALYEECLYDSDGQLLNGNLADYLVPMAAEMPDIVCAHVETPTRQSQLGAKGIGAALYEECLYSPEGQLLNGNMADYLVPMSGEMPDIVCAHIETPTKTSELGAKGAGEAGTAGAPAAVMNAINDALAPFKARVTAQPCTPERVLKALGKI